MERVYLFSLTVDKHHLLKVLLFHPEQKAVLGDACGVHDDVRRSLVLVQDLLEAVTYLVSIVSLQYEMILIELLFKVLTQNGPLDFTHSPTLCWRHLQRWRDDHLAFKSLDQSTKISTRLCSEIFPQVAMQR